MFLNNQITKLPNNQILTREFYDRDPRRVARDLLGKLLVRRTHGALVGGRIVEAEAYLGESDAAAHAAAGQTLRNAVLFGPPGHAYVYFIYGNYFCLNVSCMPEGKAGCVLFRALEPLCGLEQMAQARALAAVPQKKLRLLATGPGRLTQALGITRERDNGKDLTTTASDLVIVDDGFRPKHVLRTARIGITKNPEQMLRYVIDGNAFVSR